VTVVDTTAPVIDAHVPIVVEATTAAGANVAYSAPLSHDAVDLDVAAACLPAGGALFPIGVATVACGRTDAHGNAAAPTYFTVTVTRRATSIAYTGATGGQASDRPALSAMLAHAGDGAPVAGKPVLFSLGSQSVLGTSGATGLAAAALALNQPAASYALSASFAGDALYGPSSATAPFQARQENATILYTGDGISPVGTPLALRATVMDSAAAGYSGPSAEAAPAATIGDLSRIWVEFDVYAANSCGSGTPLQRLFAQAADTGPLGDGIGTATATLASPSSESSLCVVPRVVGGSSGSVNLWYMPTADQTQAVTFYTASGQFVAGGGWVADPQGGGNGHGNFGFNARTQKNGNAQGQLVYVWRGTYGGVAADYQVKSNSLGALAFSGASYPITATLQGKCSIQVTSQSDGASLYSDGGCTFSGSVTDVDKLAGPDSFGLTVYDKNGVLYHRVDARPLQGGNAKVQNGK
jgi:hypothetical protein